MLAVLRTRGYNLFCNKLTTSDLYFNLLAGTSFTVFVPTDSSLFALDMTSSASVYITALRYHIIPLRLSLADLQNLTSGSILPTLLPIHDIQVQRRPESESLLPMALMLCLVCSSAETSRFMDWEVFPVSELRSV
ncbi:hypothetical protein CsSME_00016112 [Camellia sinensis var. sinensis]